MKTLLKVALLTTITRRSLAFGGDNPPCELCGCSFCASGEFPMGNQAGVIPVTEEFLREFGGETLEGGDESLGDVIDQLGFTEIPCSILDLAATGGSFPPEVCVDQLRMNPILRDSCGCPDLPPLPPGFTIATPAPRNPSTPAPQFNPSAPAPQWTRSTPAPVPTLSERSIGRSEPLMDGGLRRWLVAIGLLLLATIAVCTAVRIKEIRVKERRARSTPTLSTPAAATSHEESEEVQRMYMAAIERNNLAEAMERSNMAEAMERSRVAEALERSKRDLQMNTRVSGYVNEC